MRSEAAQAGEMLSVDYGQKVLIPHNPLQPGPIYFLTPLKVDVCVVVGEAKNEAVSRFPAVTCFIIIIIFYLLQLFYVSNCH